MWHCLACVVERIPQWVGESQQTAGHVARAANVFCSSACQLAVCKSLFRKETVTSCLDMVLGSALQVPLLEQGGWARCPAAFWEALSAL